MFSQLGFGLFRLQQLSHLPISCFVKPFCRHPCIPFAQFPFCRVPFGQFRFFQFPLIFPNSCFAKSDFDQPDNTNGKISFPFRHALFSNTFSVALQSFALIYYIAFFLCLSVTHSLCRCMSPPPPPPSLSIN